MTKLGEKTYFQKIGDDGIAFTLNKPFSDPPDAGGLLHDIAAIFSLMPKKYLKILDLGCGSGWTSSFYARANHEVTGVDIAPEAILAAQKNFKEFSNLKFIVGDYDKLNFHNEFDVVIFFDSLHHCEDEDIALQTAYKALKSDGMLIACEPGRGHSKTVKSIEAMQKYGVNEKDMPPKLLKKLLRKNSFEDIKVYAYPSTTHRVLYNTRSGKRGLLTNNSIARALIVALFVTLLKTNHGIVTALKK